MDGFNGSVIEFPIFFLFFRRTINKTMETMNKLTTATKREYV